MITERLPALALLNTTAHIISHTERTARLRSEFAMFGKVMELSLKARMSLERTGKCSTVS